MKRVLIANRGEIALRIIRGCHEEGLEAVAVYSDVDRRSPHVRAADWAVEIGPAPARESYLVIEKLIDAARQTGADAVHPGYGFLAERAEFAEAVAEAGLVFVGPPPDAMRAMGEKTEARRRMQAAGLAIVPGATEPAVDARAAVATADAIGYPVMLKAAAGGGGKGMRIARTAQDVRKAFPQASSEALSAFGDGAVYVERLVERPRHVEVQVLADRFGHTLHIGERECSIQRRHQKLIEESPSPAVDLDRRLEIGEAAVRAARSVGYLGAGTVEFLLDPQGQFFFLEMNTRIQVEHPVTELVYGVDLVREQLRIAAGEPTTCPGRPMRPRGHAIECRITAEDPATDFLPATGRLTYLRVPTGPGVRWDAGVETGSEIGPHYDSLLGKLIAWGETRERAIGRMRRVLDELVIVGLPTSQPFHRRVMDDPVFAGGDYHVGYMDETGRELLARPPDDEVLAAVAVAAALAEDEARHQAHPARPADGARRGPSPWSRVARLEGLR